MNTQATGEIREREVDLLSGWVMLPVNIILLLGSIALLIFSMVVGQHAQGQPPPLWWLFFASLLLLGVSIVMLVGFFTLQPKEARVLLLFGAYRGTVRTPGFHWGNPFYSNNAGGGLRRALAAANAERKGMAANVGGIARARNKISLRSRNLNGDRLKVNDKRGNPVEIAAVVVWRVEDTAQAMFDVEDYENYVKVQSEAAVRHLASCYAYAQGEDAEITLLGNVDEISQALRGELQERLNKSGVVVEEARLTHLAYAPEIAQAMLRRQQAEAVIAARQKIVHGAVSMVEMALRELAEKQVVSLDDERKAAMVSNLMVVLCGESEVHPVVNTGTLYT
jgi:regulator of protease activity HflC (stomatin/prohibitin superfamily)